MSRVLPRLRQGTVVPDAAMIVEAVVNIANLAFLYFLLDGVELVRRVDLLNKGDYYGTYMYSIHSHYSYTMS